jgi:hypothetical protein
MNNNNVPLYRFQELPDLTELVPPETDEPNIYGAVVYKQGEVRHRFDGAVYSEWRGRRLTRTSVKVEGSGSVFRLDR